MNNVVPFHIEKPFDPSLLKAEVKNTTIGELCSMLKNDLIDLQPDFQRHGNLWDKTKKSQLIESLILGLPLPSFYFYIDRERKKWVIIDGLQRLCSLVDFFVNKTLSLSGLQFLGGTHNSRNIDSFSYFEQLEMSMRSVTLNILSGESSAEAKYIIFQRINSNGTKLKPAEVRNALFHGQSMEFAKNLASSSEFQEATSNSVSMKRLSALDYALRYMAFRLCNYSNYEDDRMNEFISNVLNFMNDKFSQEDYDSLRCDFNKSLAICYKLMGNQAFRKPLSAQEKKNKDIKQNPVSISLFESTMCAVSQLSNSEVDILINKRRQFLNLYEELFEDAEFRKHIANGTNKYKAVYSRFSMMEEVISKTIHS